MRAWGLPGWSFLPGPGAKGKGPGHTPTLPGLPAHAGPSILVIFTQGLKALTPPPWLWALT